MRAPDRLTPLPPTKRCPMCGWTMYRDTGSRSDDVQYACANRACEYEEAAGSINRSEFR
jgi:ssDNA-binding Zn-finger/Zn-ribbon topoisomerase 1